MNILADEDQDFVMTILNALVRKHSIEFDQIDSFSAEGPNLTDDALISRIRRSEQGKRIHLKTRKPGLAYENEQLGISFYRFLFGTGSAYSGVCSSIFRETRSPANR